MAPRKKFPNGFRVIKVYVQPEEYDRFLRACGASLSDWARTTLIEAADMIVPSGTAKPKGLHLPIEDTPTFKQKSSSKECAHGKPKGYNCWQCGGLAKIELA